MGHKEIHIVFLGNFPFPNGMAGTKRVQHAILALRRYKGVSVRVITQRGSSEENRPSGVWNGVPYGIIMPDLFRAKTGFMLPVLWIKTIRALDRSFRIGRLNVVYKYHFPGLDDLLPVLYARCRGYKIVYDITEDERASQSISSSIFHQLTTLFNRVIMRRIDSYADGVIVISTRLQKKYENHAQNKIPVYLRPVSVDLNRFSNRTQKMDEPVKLFYAGSFGIKDGVENLIDAFEQLAAVHNRLQLVMTGKGAPDRMNYFLNRIESSPARKKIIYMGYLNDDDYYQTLNRIDIPCMTRTDISYSHSGFPFKLGEFLATGKPVIASKVSDIPDYLTNRRNAMLVSPGSAREIVTAADYLIRNPGEASSMGAKGRDVAKAHFDYLTQGEKLYSFINNLI